MKPYRVWAENRSASCRLLADSEADAIRCIADLKVYRDKPLHVERESDNWNLSADYVVLPTSGTMQKMTKPDAHRAEGQKRPADVIGNAVQKG